MTMLKVSLVMMAYRYHNKIPLSEHVYERINELGIKQMAKRHAGFDTYDLELANKYNFIVSNVPSYSSEFNCGVCCEPGY